MQDGSIFSAADGANVQDVTALFTDIFPFAFRTREQAENYCGRLYVIRVIRVENYAGLQNGARGFDTRYCTARTEMRR